MSAPNLPPTRRRRPRDKPLTQPHELDLIRPSLVSTYFLGLLVGAYALGWVACAVTVCVHFGRHAYFVEHVRILAWWRLTTGGHLSAPWQLFAIAIWTALVLTWKRVMLVIVQTIEEFSKSK